MNAWPRRSARCSSATPAQSWSALTVLSRTAEDFKRARDALDEGHDAVLGPAEDGGYHLIGLRRSEPRLFEGIAWSTDRVLTQTRMRLSALALSWDELPVRWDLDRPEDYERLLADAELGALAAGLGRLHAAS